MGAVRAEVGRPARGAAEGLVRLPAALQVDGLPIFAPPPPPTGPATDTRKFEPGLEERYQAWKLTEAGARVWRYVERAALDRAARGERRIGLQGIFEDARQQDWHPTVNHNFRSLIARDLIARHPHLLERIERRQRKGP